MNVKTAAINSIIPMQAKINPIIYIVLFLFDAFCKGALSVLEGVLYGFSVESLMY